MKSNVTTDEKYYTGYKRVRNKYDKGDRLLEGTRNESVVVKSCRFRNRIIIST